MSVRLLARIAAVLGLIFGVCVGAVWYAARGVDVSVYRALIEQTVENMTGRSLKIDGDIQLELLSFSPTIVAESASLANASWGSRPEMAKIGEIQARIALIPFLSGDIAIDRLILIKPDILLESDGKGKVNWLFDSPPEAQKEETTGGGRLFMGEMLIKNGTLTYLVGKEADVVVVEQATFKTDSPFDPVDFEISGAWNGRAFDMQATLGALGVFWAPKNGEEEQRYPIEGKGKLANIGVSFDGALVRREKGWEHDVRITANSPDLAETGRAFALSFPSLGKVQASGVLGGALDRPGLAGVSIKGGGGGRPSVQASGSINDLAGAIKTDLAVALEADSLDHLGRALAVDLSFPAPVKLSGKLTGLGGVWKAQGVKAKIGGSDVGGDISVTLSGARPRIVATLSSEQVEWDEIFQALKGEAEGGETEKLIPDAPLPTEALKAVDLTLNWSVKKLNAPDFSMENIALPLVVQNGRMDVSPSVGAVLGGALRGNLSFDAAKKPASVSLKLDGDQMSLTALLAALGVVAEYSGGASDIDVALTGAGDSLGAVLATLDGKAHIVIGRMMLKDARADMMVLDVMREIWPFANTRDTDVKCVVGELSVRQGTAHLDSFLLDTSRMTVLGEGAVTLPSERLDVTLWPSAKDATLLGVNIAIDIEGSFANPKIGPNPGGVAQGIVGGVAGLALSPLLILGSVFGVGDGGNPCLAAIEQIKGGTLGHLPSAVAPGAEKEGKQE